ncbi:hypothetical protein RCL1_004336 [Eukaryota sp. TZLM3-RCL]
MPKIRKKQYAIETVPLTPVSSLTDLSCTLSSFDESTITDPSIKNVFERLTYQSQESEEEEEEPELIPSLPTRKRRSTPEDEDLSSASESESDTEESALRHLASGKSFSSLSNKQRKAVMRPTVAQLKMQSVRSDLVEFWDTTAPEPSILLHLKACRNTVSVPRHWAERKKYLQGKRGVPKPPFVLPSYIVETGVVGLRETTLKEFEKGLKTRMRQRLDPKTHRFEVDYQVLYDAFFKFQTKPQLTTHSDVYYEGREFEAHVKTCRPGKLSGRLRKALGIAPTAPPPWLVNQQRHGPPPSYPLLKIPGLNCPIPKGGKWGYHPGGWGKAPVDINGNGLYGDVFGAVEELTPEEKQIKEYTWGKFKYIDGAVVSETLEGAGVVTVQSIAQKKVEEDMEETISKDRELLQGIEYATPGSHGGIVDMT